MTKAQYCFMDFINDLFCWNLRELLSYSLKDIVHFGYYLTII